MSPDGIDPQEAVYGDTYRPRKKKAVIPSQPSPTNLSDELVTRLQTTLRMVSRIGEDLMRNQNLMDEAVNQITAAYAEAIEAIIGEDESEYRVVDTEYAGPKRHRQTNGNNVVRNSLRAEQRQRLQRLLPTNGSDGGGADKPHGKQQ